MGDADTAGAGSDEAPGGRWEAVRSARLERHRSRARRWISERLDRAEDRLPESGVDVVERLRDRDALLFAGGLAFYSLVSAAPALLLLAWITGSLLGEDRVSSVAERFQELAPGEVEIESFMRSLLEVGTGVGLIALVGAVWPATAFGSGLARAFDAMSVDEDPALHGLRGRARALAVIVLLPLLLLGGFAAATVSTAAIGGGALLTALGWIVAVVSGMVISWVAVTGLLWWFGPADVRFRALAIGAGASAVGLVVMSLGYLVYLSYGADWEERVAGSGMAAVVLLALWLYLANLLLLAGYAIALALDEGEHRPPEGSDASDASGDSGESEQATEPVEPGG
jgi:membrane protein